MAEAYALPKWGLTMEEGTIAEWLVSEGDQVSKGQVLAMIETDKIEVEFDSPTSGTVERILVAEGETIDVGTDVIEIG